MAPANPHSCSAIAMALTDSAPTSHDASTPSHLATVAVLARSASTFASALATSHLATTVSLTQPASTPPSTEAPPHTTSWYSQPNTRGTWQLLITCLITINLCVWTAIHLNIPAKLDRGQPLRLRLWSSYYCLRARWVLLGLLAPELVVYTAWMQWESARQFAKETGVTMTHGFYAGMGAYYLGLETHTPSDDQEQRRSQPSKSIPADNHEGNRQLEMISGAGASGPIEAATPTPLDVPMLQQHSSANNKSQRASTQRASGSLESSARPSQRLYLTAQGVLTLVKAGKLSLPPKEAITERSKSDVLAKTLVCLQAGYIIVQCVSRVASGLPLTFLEINTLGHVLCALIMYSFWLHKPQDLNLSIPLEAGISKLVGNWHLACYGISLTSYFCSLYKIVWERVKIARPSEALDLRGPPPTSVLYSAIQSRQPRVVEGYPKESDVARLTGDDCVLVLRSWDLVDNFFDDVMTELRRNSCVWNLFTAIYVVESWGAVPTYINGSSHVRRCDIYSLKIQQVESGIRQLLDTNTEPFEYSHALCEQEISNWPSSGLLSAHTFLPPLAIAISTALYGGLHAAAWHSFFPTEVEKWLWRASSIAVAGTGLLFAYGMIAYRLWLKFYPMNNRSWVRALAQTLNWMLEVTSIDGNDFEVRSWFAVVMYTSSGACCVISRLFLVVESFISLRKVLIEVYQTPDWTQWIPHL